MDTDIIRIPAGPLQPALVEFAQASALANCTSLHDTLGDSVTVTPCWPVAAFSDGEKVLWRILCSLTTGDLDEATRRLDAPNLRALCGVFAAMAVTA